jgi:hypothetical protein
VEAVPFKEARFFGMTQQLAEKVTLGDETMLQRPKPNSFCGLLQKRFVRLFSASFQVMP